MSLTQSRLRRKKRIRAKIFGNTICPRISVFRSNRRLFVQLIDDQKGVTLFGKGTVKAIQGSNKKTVAYDLGVEIAKEAQKQKITKAIFDRSGYIYHGRIKSLAEGLREGGLKF